MKDGVVLMYLKDGVLFPVALTAEQNEMLQLTAMMFNPMKVLVDKPVGQAANWLDKNLH